jgi:hypothetical protein
MPLDVETFLTPTVTGAAILHQTSRSTAPELRGVRLSERRGRCFGWVVPQCHSEVIESCMYSGGGSSVHPG